MAEPEEVLVEGAYLATEWAAALWRRNRTGAPPLPTLADARGRIEVFLGALRPDAPEVVVAEPPAPMHLLGRWVRRVPAHLVAKRAVPSTDGWRIRLPRSMDAPNPAAVHELYRLLALEMATRAERGTPHELPPEPRARDLYLLAEAAAVDARIARETPGLVPRMVLERGRARAFRPELSVLTGPERAVEALLCGLLEAPPETPPAVFATGGAPRDARRWAEERAADPAFARGAYRGLPPVLLWGRTDPLPERLAAPLSTSSEDADDSVQTRVTTVERRPRVRESTPEEDDPRPGMMMVPVDDRQEKAEDPFGLQRPTDRDDLADAEALAESLAELTEARTVATSAKPREVLASEDPVGTRARGSDLPVTVDGVRYPEWDYRAGRYLEDHVVVRRVAPAEDGARWARAALVEHRGLVRQVRRTFERLRPRRERLRRRPDGEEVDLDAFVEARADARAGRAPEDRLYLSHRPRRRDAAILILADGSASTDSWIGGGHRIIDVEKAALLVACEALEALGDAYAVLAFSGEGPRGVRIASLKSFSERHGPAVRARVGGLEPDRYTRIGAALRHATALLCRQPAHHRLLLVLSDGRPNDVDEYEGRYGVEDARQAAVEARAQRAHLFCLTVDRQAPAYLPRIFGARGMALLRRPDRLPRVLTTVVRRLVAS